MVMQSKFFDGNDRKIYVSVLSETHMVVKLQKIKNVYSPIVTVSRIVCEHNAHVKLKLTYLQK